MPRPRVKICCISSLDEARTAIAAGADALGLVSPMPSGPGCLPNDAIASITPHIPPPIATFLLTCLQDTPSIIAQFRLTRCNTLQLCDTLTTGTYADLRAAFPLVRLVQVIHVQSESSIDEATRVAPHVDALLLDSGRPSLPVKELGGTGRTHDWSLSRRIRDAVHPHTPLFLAGGLTERNVADALAHVQPFGLDLCSSVRTNGKLDPAKLHRFFSALHSATSVMNLPNPPPPSDL